ncbi:MAG: hypothetical protein HEP70_00265 [Rhodobiaceae bacterium]|nr:hypothetical protein [Rhodobiaceae bacterium]
MTELERTQHIYCIGDSHCLPLKNKIVRTPMEKTPLLVSSDYLVGFCSSEFVDASGQLAEPVVEILKKNRLADESGQNVWNNLDHTAANLAFAAGTPATTPILVIFCGDIDLRGNVFKQFQDVYDFDMPDGSGNADHEAQKLPFDSVEDLLTAKYTPILQGLVALYGSGFTRTYLAALPLPSQEDEEEFADAHGFKCPLPLRIKLTKLSNQVLARLCRVANVPFIDVSDHVEEDGLLAREHRLDGFHMTSEASTLLLDAVLDHAVHNCSSHVNMDLYEHARVNAEGPTLDATIEFADSREKFISNPVLQLETDCTQIQKVIEALPADASVSNEHQRLSWFGTSREPFNRNMRSVTPNEELIHRVFEYVYSDAVLPHLQAALNGDPHVINARYFRSLPHGDEAEGPQTFHFDGAPPGVLRALVYLTDVDESSGPFEFLTDAGENIHAVGPTGTLLIFDPNKLEHRGRPPEKRERRVVDMCIAARPKGFPRRVAWAGMNAWPLDPYQYAVDGMTAVPPFEKDWVQVYPFGHNHR